MKTFDLVKNQQSFTNNVQTNLDLLFNMMFETKKIKTKIKIAIFTIKYNDISIKVKLTKAKSVTNNIEFYSLFYKSITNDDILPFKIDYIHPFTLEVNNDCYIVNLHKLDNISGSQIMDLIINFNKILNVQNIYVSDGATVKIGNRNANLSFIKMIETNKTYYMRFGFNFSLYGNIDYTLKFNTIDDLHKLLNKILKNIRSITVKQILNEYTKLQTILNLINDTNMNNLKIYLKGRPSIVPIYASKIYKKVITIDVINELKKETDSIIDLISKFNYKYIYEILVELFNKRDERYEIISDLTLSQRYITKFEEHIIKRKYIIWFHLLSLLIRNYSYVLNLQ